MGAIGAEECRCLDLIEHIVDEETVRLQPDAVDYRIGADPAGHQHQRVVNGAFLVVDRFRTKSLGKLQTMREMIDRDDAFGPHQECRLHREQPDRAAAPDGDRIARLNLRIFRSHPAGRQDVGQKQHLFVRDAVGNNDRPDVAERDADIFRLAAGVAAGHVAVAEQPRHRLAVELLCDVLIVGGQAIVAGRILMLAAVIAAAAGDRERDDDLLALLQCRFRPDLDHFAHEFVAQYVAGLHRRDITVIEMQVRPADRGRGDLDDAVARVDDFGIIDGIDANVMLAVPCQCAHQAASSSCCLRFIAAVAISPVSISCLNRRRSRRAWIAGSRWNSLAISLPTTPAGGS